MADRVAAAQRRIDAALGTLLTTWMPEHNGTDLRHLRRNRLTREWPALAGALDELLLAVTARSAAEVAQSAERALQASLCSESGYPLELEGATVLRDAEGGLHTRCPSCGSKLVVPADAPDPVVPNHPVAH